MKAAHTKSRLSCLTCKSRRVECDQTKPICTRCSNAGSQCSYGKFLSAKQPTVLSKTTSQPPLTVSTDQRPLPFSQENGYWKPAGTPQHDCEAIRAPASPRTAVMEAWWNNFSAARLREQMEHQPTDNLQPIDDAICLEYLFVCLGGLNITHYILSRAAGSCSSFNRAGQLRDESPFELIPVLRDSSRLKLAVNSLERRRLVVSTPGSFQVPVGRRRPPLVIPLEFKVQVLKLICHTFPLSEAIEPYSFTEVGMAQLPQARHLLRDDDLGQLIRSCSIPERQKVVEFCLSFTRFSSDDWENALAVAEMISVSLGDTLLKERVLLRKEELFYCSGLSLPPPVQSDITGIDAASNTFLGERILFEAQVLVDQFQLDDALLRLDGWHPLDPSHISPLEKFNVLDRIQLLRGIIYRYSHRSTLAMDLLTPLLSSWLSRDAAVPHLVAVLCEFGNTTDAKKLLEYEDRHQVDERRLRCLKLADAEVYLMEALYAAEHQNLPKAQSVLCLAKNQYQGLAELLLVCRNDRKTRLHKFSVSAGLAIIAHLQLEFSNNINDQLQAASSNWQSTWQLAEQSWADFGWEWISTHQTIFRSITQIGLKTGQSLEQPFS